MINWIKRWRRARRGKKNLKMYNDAVEQLTMRMQVDNPRLSKRAAAKKARAVIAQKLKQNPPPKKRAKLKVV